MRTVVRLVPLLEQAKLWCMLHILPLHCPLDWWAVVGLDERLQGRPKPSVVLTIREWHLLSTIVDVKHLPSGPQRPGGLEVCIRLEQFR